MSLIRKNYIGKNKRPGIFVPTKKHKSVEIVRKAEEKKELPPVVSEAQEAVNQAKATMKKTKRTYKKRQPATRKKTVKKTAVKKKGVTKRKPAKKSVKRRKITTKAHIFDLIKALKSKK